MSLTEINETAAKNLKRPGLARGHTHGKRIGPFISTCGPILYAFGTIEAGKRGDLILVNENPLDNVAHLKDLCGVMAAGRWYDRVALQKIMALPDQQAGSHPP